MHLVALRGFGETQIGDNVSGGLAGPAASEIERYIREQRIDRPAVIGHSLGGQIAHAFGLRAPYFVGAGFVVLAICVSLRHVNSRTIAAAMAEGTDGAAIGTDVTAPEDQPSSSSSSSI